MWHRIAATLAASLLPLLLSTVRLVDSLKCYHCAEPSAQIDQHLWLHNTPMGCSRWAAVRCPVGVTTCVIVRMWHPQANFTITGCSEDLIDGCFRHDVPESGGVVEMCQCQWSRCNTEYAFSRTTPSMSSTATTGLARSWLQGLRSVEPQTEQRPSHRCPHPEQSSAADTSRSISGQLFCVWGLVFISYWLLSFSNMARCI